MSQKIITEDNCLLKFGKPYEVDSKSSSQKRASLSFIRKKPLKFNDLATNITTDTRTILNIIAKPREWDEDGKLWKQEVSIEPAGRSDILRLAEDLRLRVKERRARNTGICEIRSSLYTQAFDEIIRQVTINCVERGMLLLRIRDEYEMTLSVHEALCEHSLSFGTQKSMLQEEGGNAELNEEIAALEAEKTAIRREMVEIQLKFLMLKRRTEELQETQEKNHTEEIKFLQNANQQLKAQLESIIAPKK